MVVLIRVVWEAASVMMESWADDQDEVGLKSAASAAYPSPAVRPKPWSPTISNTATAIVSACFIIWFDRSRDVHNLGPSFFPKLFRSLKLLEHFLSHGQICLSHVASEQATLKGIVMKMSWIHSIRLETLPKVEQHPHLYTPLRGRIRRTPLAPCHMHPRAPPAKSAATTYLK